MAKYQIKLCERQLEGGIYLEEFKYMSNADTCVFNLLHNYGRSYFNCAMQNKAVLCEVYVHFSFDTARRILPLVFKSKSEAVFLYTINRCNLLAMLGIVHNCQHYQYSLGEGVREINVDVDFDVVGFPYFGTKCTFLHCIFCQN